MITDTKLEILSTYCATKAVQIDMIKNDLEAIYLETMKRMTNILKRLDVIGDVEDKLAISLVEAAKGQKPAEPAKKPTVKKAAKAPAKKAEEKPTKAPEKKVAEKPAKAPAKKAPAAPAKPVKAEGQKKLSETPGISWDKNRQKWVANYRKDGKKVFIGRYSTEAEAKEAQAEAMKAAEAQAAPAKAPAKKPAAKKPVKAPAKKNTAKK